MAEENHGKCKIVSASAVRRNTERIEEVGVDRSVNSKPEGHQGHHLQEGTFLGRKERSDIAI